MSESLLLAIGSACWLGILTSLSPCPLATNIAAISYLGKRVENPRQVLLNGVMYTLGRMITYTAIGAIVVASLLSVPEISFFLQTSMNKILGPLLFVVGLIMLDLLPLRLPSVSADGWQERVEKYGLWGAGLMGLLFALSFCPVSAALFFGSLIPMALQHRSSLLLPGLYGIGTALPVALFAILIALGAQALGRAFDRLTQFERWARRITAIIFILIGLYFSLTYWLGLDFGF
ncbi:MAG: sulfite exporter TauE/SafE family protein [Candidatus Zixiibacteriota bacterium]|nr:MAG: sulfite exporter TauE/SafE family protein [candidate division Zixibacteria bacterium]